MAAAAKVREVPAARATLAEVERARAEVLTAEQVARHARKRRAWVLRECEAAERGEPSAFPNAKRDAPLRPWRIPVADVLAFLRR